MDLDLDVAWQRLCQQNVKENMPPSCFLVKFSRLLFKCDGKKSPKKLNFGDFYHWLRSCVYLLHRRWGGRFADNQRAFHQVVTSRGHLFTAQYIQNDLHGKLTHAKLGLIDRC